MKLRDLVRSKQKTSSARPAFSVAQRSESCAWRDALGPGYAVGITQELATFVAATASAPYRCR